MKLKKCVLWVDISIVIYSEYDNLEQSVRFTLFNENRLLYRCDIYAYVWGKIMNFVLKNEGKIGGYKILSQYTFVDESGINHNFLCRYLSYDYEKLFDLFYQKLITLTE